MKNAVINRISARRGFTLMELLVVITIIGLLGAMVLPSIITMFNSGSDTQAYAILAAQLSAARSLAMKTSRYTVVHIQQADPTISGPNKSQFFAAVLIRSGYTYYDYTSGVYRTNNNFYHDQILASGKWVSGQPDSYHPTWATNQWGGCWVRIVSGTGTAVGLCSMITGNSATTLTLASGVGYPSADAYYIIYRPTGIEPVPLPGGIAFGGISFGTQTNPFMTGTAFTAAKLGDTTGTSALNQQMGQCFATLNLIFSPSGMLVPSVPGFDTSNPPLPVAAGVTFDTVAPGTDPITGTKIVSLFWDDSDNATNDPNDTSKHPDLKMRIWSRRDNYATTPLDCRITTPQFGAMAVTMFDFSKFSMISGATRATFLTNDCPLLPINVYTGQMLPRK